MKRFVAILILYGIFVFVSYSQIESEKFSIYPRIGINVSKINNDNIDIYDVNGLSSGVLKPNFKFGFLAGAEIHYEINSRFAAGIGAIYSIQGTSYKDILYETDSYKWTIEDNKTNLHYINFPILFIVNYGFLDYYNCHIAFGIETGLKIKEKNHSIEQYVYTFDYTRNMFNQCEINEIFKMLDLSIPIGIGIELNKYCIDIRYYNGIININKFIKPHSKSQRIELIIGYKIDISS